MLTFLEISWTCSRIGREQISYVGQCLSNSGLRIPGGPRGWTKGPRDYLIVLFSSSEKACEMK
jgi:hypothetical protein